MARARFELRHITPQNIRDRELTQEEWAAVGGAVLLILAIEILGLVFFLRRRKQRREARAVITDHPAR